MLILYLSICLAFLSLLSLCCLYTFKKSNKPALVAMLHRWSGRDVRVLNSPDYSAIDAVQGRKLLETGMSSDFIIECRGRTWNVHKLIISINSDYFAQLCDPRFWVSSAPICHQQEHGTKSRADQVCARNRRSESRSER
jgi:hypothetical protein